MKSESQLTLLIICEKSDLWVLKEKEGSALRLPGGVIQSEQESALEGAARCAYEEGLLVGGLFRRLHKSCMSTNHIEWLWFDSAKVMKKEESRYTPMLMPAEEAIPMLSGLHLYQDLETVWRGFKKN